MRSLRSRSWLGIAVLGLVALILAGSAARAADPPSGGGLVIGLDQEPPTLDPHASPSAVTYLDPRLKV